MNQIIGVVVIISGLILIAMTAPWILGLAALVFGYALVREP